MALRPVIVHAADYKAYTSRGSPFMQGPRTDVLFVWYYIDGPGRDWPFDRIEMFRNPQEVTRRSDRSTFARLRMKILDEERMTWYQERLPFPKLRNAPVNGVKRKRHVRFCRREIPKVLCREMFDPYVLFLELVSGQSPHEVEEDDTEC
jgi:hypothetical protein